MDAKKTILITGANGQLGNEFRALASIYTDYHFLFASKDDLPIDDYEAVELFFQNNKIDYCINCAAYTAVDKAESEPDKAFSINANGASNLATQCQYYHTKLIHISTDYIFDGTAIEPIKETAATNPIGVYGASKLKGEQLVLQINPSAIIIRTSWVYSSFGNNFVKTMLRLMNERESINVVNDQIGIPTYARDLAEATMKIISQLSTLPTGRQAFNSQPCLLAGRLSTFNFSNSGESISWHQFALAIKDFVKSSCIVNPIPSSQFPTAAKRPAYSVLDTTLIQQTFNIQIPEWKESLKKVIDKLLG